MTKFYFLTNLCMAMNLSYAVIIFTDNGLHSTILVAIQILQFVIFHIMTQLTGNKILTPNIVI